MSSKANIKPNAKPAEPPVTPPASSSYAPSVPISLYREVANELQSAKTRAESLRLQNQELLQQNQHLRIEIERVVQSALQLRQAAEAHSSTSSSAVLPDAALSAVEVHFDPPIAPPSPLPPPPAPPSLPHPPRQPIFTEQQPQQRRTTQVEKNSELGGWWLILAILVIVVTAFGTGFLIVRPLLPHR
jgi:hypothetical protein